LLIFAVKSPWVFSWQQRVNGWTPNKKFVIGDVQNPHLSNISAICMPFMLGVMEINRNDINSNGWIK
jgi:hypothetical protein